jgi:hypothetical protein
VCFGVLPGRVLGMVGCMQMVSMGSVRVMGGLFMVARFMVLRRFGVVMGRLRMVMGSLGVVLRCFLRHGDFLHACRLFSAARSHESSVSRTTAGVTAVSIHREYPGQGRQSIFAPFFNSPRSPKLHPFPAPVRISLTSQPLPRNPLL